MKIPLLALLPLCLATFAGPAIAGPATDLAQARSAAVARGDVAALTASYAPNATLHWIGGPLDGSYVADKTKEVWTNVLVYTGDKLADEIWQVDPNGEF